MSDATHLYHRIAVLPVGVKVPIGQLAREINATQAVTLSLIQGLVESGRLDRSTLRPRTRHRKDEWRPAEDEVIREHFVAGGADACLSHLSGRSRSAIMQRACRLGLKSDRRLFWTDEEDDVIRKLYRDGGVKACLPKLTRRGPHSIKTRAKFLGVKRDEGFRKLPKGPCRRRVKQDPAQGRRAPEAAREGGAAGGGQSSPAAPSPARPPAPLPSKAWPERDPEAEFQAQLERVARGEVGIAPAFTPRKASLDRTFGGVSSAYDGPGS
jgi:hypothetical protein